MLHSVDIILILLSTVVALEMVSRRIALPSPFLLLPAGILLGFVPRFPQMSLDPDVVMTIFLPLLVYSGSALGSWVEFRKNIRPITLLSVGCVLFTTVFVAMAAHYWIPGFEWAAAFVLGGIVSPPDEVAAISIARRLGIPKGLAAVLEGEGLANDATALTVYRFAVAALVTHYFSPAKALGNFFAIISGEILWGFVVGWTMLRLRRWMRDTSLEVSLSLLTPFVAYLPAEMLGGTGVLATVTAGLYVSYMNSHLVSATTRTAAVSMWQIIEFVLDGLLFLVAGMQLHAILQPLGAMDGLHLWCYGIGVSALVIVLRMIWVYAAIYLPYRIKPAYCPIRASQLTWQRVFVISWSGMRGAISLAAALSIPLLTAAGTAFPGRNLIIFLTFCVIVSTLLIQGLSLPWLIRHFGIDREGRKELAEAGHQEIEARLKAAQASLALLSERRKEGAYPEPLLDRIVNEYTYRNTQFQEHLAGDHDGAVQHGTHQFNVTAELIATERRVMLELRRTGAIDDVILRRIEKDLDLQELRLRQGIAEYELSPTDN